MGLSAHQEDFDACNYKKPSVWTIKFSYTIGKTKILCCGVWYSVLWSHVIFRCLPTFRRNLSTRSSGLVRDIPPKLRQAPVRPQSASSSPWEPHIAHKTVLQDGRLLRCCAVLSGRNWPTFQTGLLLSSSDIITLMMVAVRISETSSVSTRLHSLWKPEISPRFCKLS